MPAGSQRWLTPFNYLVRPYLITGRFQGKPTGVTSVASLTLLPVPDM